MNRYPQVAIFWGAGATAGLGMRTSLQQAEFLRELAPGPGACEPLGARVRVALGDGIDSRWREALTDLLTILGDHEAAETNKPIRTSCPVTLGVANVTREQTEAMERNWWNDDSKEIRSRIVHLRVLYDWPALVATINICPRRSPEQGAGRHKSDDGGFEIQDLFNVLDLHHQSGHGFPGREGTFLTPQQLLGARNALGLLLQVVQYVDWHSRASLRASLSHHYDFGIALGRRMQRQGRHIAAGLGGEVLDDPSFVVGPVSIVSLNWDSIGLWVQFIANRDLNNSPAAPRVGSPARRLQVFHDLAHFVSGPRVNKQHAGAVVWQPMNASSARQLNDPAHGSDVRIRVSKYLFPHGSLWWRECPSCGKLSSFHGDKWELGSETLFPPPPLRAFSKGITFDSWLEHLRDPKDTERELWKRGEVDARACVHCHEMTYAHHASLVMQTNFKQPPPSFIEEIQREMRVVVQEADHIVLMGYSLPRDDVAYRAFFAARTRRQDYRQDPVRCSVVSKDDEYGARWFGPAELDIHAGRGRVPDVVVSARALFGPDNVRFYGGGVPDVFMDGASVSGEAVEQLLNWDVAS